MLNITKEALLVHKTLLSKGLETPLKNNLYDKNTKKNLISKKMFSIMKLLNLDLNDDSLSKTPSRISNMYMEELFFGLNYANFPKITVIKNKMKTEEMITIRNITLTSTCEHHFIVIDGKATISYIPKDYILGLSKINRIVQFFALRPQVQERLTIQIRVALQTILNSKNVAVCIDAIHYCVKARGIKDTNSITTTISLGGSFKSKQETRETFLHFINRKF